MVCSVALTPRHNYFEYTFTPTDSRCLDLISTGEHEISSFKKKKSFLNFGPFWKKNPVSSKNA